MQNWQVIAVIGFVLFLGGGLGAMIGTTSMGLFITYGVIVVAGILLLSYATKLRDRR